MSNETSAHDLSLKPIIPHCLAWRYDFCLVPTKEHARFATYSGEDCLARVGEGVKAATDWIAGASAARNGCNRAQGPRLTAGVFGASGEGERGLNP